jgi:D-alanyl-D-alanine carboxypeptidase
MQDTVPAPGISVRPGDAGYGLGLQTFPLSCGGVAWTHGGDVFGYETRHAVTEDGRAAVVAVTGLPTSLDTVRHVEEAVDGALCD